MENKTHFLAYLRSKRGNRCQKPSSGSGTYIWAPERSFSWLPNNWLITMTPGWKSGDMIKEELKKARIGHVGVGDEWVDHRVSLGQWNILQGKFWWIHEITHLFKPMECTPSRVNLNVKYGFSRRESWWKLWVIMMSPCGFISCNKCSRCVGGGDKKCW